MTIEEDLARDMQNLAQLAGVQEYICIVVRQEDTIGYCSPSLKAYEKVLSEVARSAAQQPLRVTDDRRPLRLLRLEAIQEIMYTKHVELHPIVAALIDAMNVVEGRRHHKSKADDTTLPPWFPGPLEAYQERVQRMNFAQLFSVMDAIFDYIRETHWDRTKIVQLRDELLGSAWVPLTSSIGTWAKVMCLFEALENQAPLGGEEIQEWAPVPSLAAKGARVLDEMWVSYLAKLAEDKQKEKVGKGGKKRKIDLQVQTETRVPAPRGTAQASHQQGGVTTPPQTDEEPQQQGSDVTHPLSGGGVPPFSPGVTSRAPPLRRNPKPRGRQPERRRQPTPPLFGAPVATRFPEILEQPEPEALIQRMGWGIGHEGGPPLGAVWNGEVVNDDNPAQASKERSEAPLSMADFEGSLFQEDPDPYAAGLGIAPRAAMDTTQEEPSLLEDLEGALTQERLLELAQLEGWEQDVQGQSFQLPPVRGYAQDPFQQGAYQIPGPVELGPPAAAARLWPQALPQDDRQQQLSQNELQNAGDVWNGRLTPPAFRPQERRNHAAPSFSTAASGVKREPAADPPKRSFLRRTVGRLGLIVSKGKAAAERGKQESGESAEEKPVPGVNLAHSAPGGSADKRPEQQDSRSTLSGTQRRRRASARGIPLPPGGNLEREKQSKPAPLPRNGAPSKSFKWRTSTKRGADEKGAEACPAFPMQREVLPVSLTGRAAGGSVNTGAQAAGGRVNTGPLSAGGSVNTGARYAGVGGAAGAGLERRLQSLTLSPGAPVHTRLNSAAQHGVKTGTRLPVGSLDAAWTYNRTLPEVDSAALAGRMAGGSRSSSDVDGLDSFTDGSDDGTADGTVADGGPVAEAQRAVSIAGGGRSALAGASIVAGSVSAASQDAVDGSGRLDAGANARVASFVRPLATNVEARVAGPADGKPAAAVAALSASGTIPATAENGLVMSERARETRPEQHEAPPNQTPAVLGNAQALPRADSPSSQDSSPSLDGSQSPSSVLPGGPERAQSGPPAAKLFLQQAGKTGARIGVHMHALEADSAFKGAPLFALGGSEGGLVENGKVNGLGSPVPAMTVFGGLGTDEVALRMAHLQLKAPK